MATVPHIDSSLLAFWENCCRLFFYLVNFTQEQLWTARKRVVCWPPCFAVSHPKVTGSFEIKLSGQSWPIAHRKRYWKTTDCLSDSKTRLTLFPQYTVWSMKKLAWRIIFPIAWWQFEKYFFFDLLLIIIEYHMMYHSCK